mgnify:CR=1 FL=1
MLGVFHNARSESGLVFEIAAVTVEAERFHVVHRAAKMPGRRQEDRPSEPGNMANALSPTLATSRPSSERGERNPRRCRGSGRLSRRDRGTLLMPPSLDRSHGDLVRRDVFQHGAGMAMRREPCFRRSAVGGEMKQLGRLSLAVENTNRAGLRRFGHDEREGAVDREGLVDPENDDAGAAEIALMQGDAGG